jgi:predicted GIY-YIG superfamily endonuclease
VTTRRTCLYRLYDAQNALLYIGISYYPDERIHRHRSDRTWGLDIDMSKTSLEWYDTRPAARAAEIKAIHDEQPLHNVAETPFHRRVSGFKNYLTPEELERWHATDTISGRQSAEAHAAACR